MGEWYSRRDGFVTLDNLRVGTTNIISNEIKKTYFYNSHLYVPVTTSSELNRPVVLVPSSNKGMNEILDVMNYILIQTSLWRLRTWSPEGLTLSLTWVGN